MSGLSGFTDHSSDYSGGSRDHVLVDTEISLRTSPRVRPPEVQAK
jgi:hypothetical protein